MLIEGWYNGSNYTQFYYQATGALTINQASVSPGSTYQINTNRLLRDPSAWYHIMLVIDTTQGTASNRVKLYINGVQETSFASAAYPNQNTSHQLNRNGNVTFIGRRNSGDVGLYVNGYMANIECTDAQALTPSYFGSTNSDSGIWTPVPADTISSYGNNGLKLAFANAGALGTDTSGEGNNFTANSITSINQSSDSPSNNFATWSPLYGGNSQYATFSEGNLKLAGNNASNAGTNLNSTVAASSGKYYMEVKALDIQGNSYPAVGVIMEDDVYVSLGQVGGNTNSVSYSPNGQKNIGGTASSYGNSFTDNDIIGIALDLDNGAVYFSKNGTFQASGNPTSGSSRTNAAYTFTASSKLYFFAATVYQTTSILSANFGSPSYAISSGNADSNGLGQFEYAPPTGYFSLCTNNLNLLG